MFPIIFAKNHMRNDREKQTESLSRTLGHLS